RQPRSSSQRLSCSLEGTATLIARREECGGAKEQAADPEHQRGEDERFDGLLDLVLDRRDRLLGAGLGLRSNVCLEVAQFLIDGGTAGDQLEEPLEVFDCAVEHAPT